VVQYFPISVTASNYSDLDFKKNYTFRVYVQNDAGWSIPTNITQQVAQICSTPAVYTRCLSDFW